MRSVLITTVSLAVLAFAMPVCAAAPVKSKPAAAKQNVQSLMKALEEQKRQLDKQQQALAAQQRALAEQEQKFLELQGKVAAMTQSTPPAAPNSGVDKTQASGVKTASVANSAAPKEVGTDRKQERDKPPEIAAELDEGGVLLPKGRVVVTPSMEYTRSSATRVAIQGFSIIPALNIGTFQVSRVGRDVVTGALGARVGVTNRLELEGKIPYVYRQDSTTGRVIGGGSAADTTTTVDGSGIGDVEIGAHYQVTDGHNGWPFLIANLRYKTTTGTGPFEVPTDSGTGLQTELPTGSGFSAVQPSITAIYPSDPVVFYANLGYLHSFDENFGGTIGDIQPGDTYSGSFGMSLSLNDKASVSMGYSHSMVFKSEQNGNVIPNSTNLQVGTLDLGYSYSLNDMISLNFNSSIGATEDAPDARLVFRVPIAMDLF